MLLLCGTKDHCPCHADLLGRKGQKGKFLPHILWVVAWFEELCKWLKVLLIISILCKLYKAEISLILDITFSLFWLIDWLNIQGFSNARQGLHCDSDWKEGVCLLWNQGHDYRICQCAIKEWVYKELCSVNDSDNHGSLYQLPWLL